MPAIHPIQPILVVILAIVLWYIKRKPADKPTLQYRGKGVGSQPAKKSKKAKEEEAHQLVRQQALQTKRDSLGLPAATSDDEVHGLLMEMEIAGSVVTLVCFANGAARVHYQSGGVLEANAAHREVHKAAKDLIALGQRSLPRMTKTPAPPLPEPGKIRFHVLTPRTIFSTETDREAIGQPGNSLTQLFYAGQEVVSQLRQAQAEAESTVQPA